MSNNIVIATISVRGARPLLWHAFGPDALPLEKQEKSGVAGNDPTEWRQTVLYTKEGQLYLPPTYAFSCLREAGRYTKRGRANISKYIAATLQITDTRISIDRWIPNFNGGLPDELTTDSDEPVYLSIMGVVNPSTRARNVRYRVAASPDYHATFSAMWDVTVVSRGEMEAVAIDGGKLVGWGDGRSIGFGRFDIVSFDVEE